MILEIGIAAGGTLTVGVSLSWWRKRRRLAGLLAPGERLLFYNAPAVQPGSPIARQMPEPAQALVRLFGAGLIDRTGTLDLGVPALVLDPLPDGGRSLLSGPSIPLDVLCRERARSLLAAARDKNCGIDVLWSGGIDSTAALLVLLEAAEAAGELDRLCVLHSRRSIREYRWLFRNRLKAKAALRRFRSDLPSALDLGRITISGEMGDQLFGSALAESAVRQGQAFRPWRQPFVAMLQRAGTRDGAAKAVCRWLEPLIDQAPVPIETLFDLLWWLNFTLKWQSVDLCIAVGHRAQPRTAHQRLVHFYASADFQRWSLQNRDQAIGDDWASYKRPLKLLISDLTGDQDYLRRKTKEPSLRDSTANGLRQMAVTVTADWQVRRVAAGFRSAGDNSGG